MCYNLKKVYILTEEAVGEKKILCPDCGKFLLKVTQDTKGTTICWCRRCRDEKTIPIYDRAVEPNVQR